MKQKASVWCGVLAVCIWGLAGCSSLGQEDTYEFPDLTLAEAREIQNTQLQVFIDMVPEEQVLEVWGPIPEAGAMSCDTGLGGERLFWKEDTGSYSLPGGARVTVEETFDVLAFLEEVAGRYEAMGWGTKEEDVSLPRLVLYPPDGFIYSLTFSPRQAEHPQSVRLDSFSPCFIPEREISLHREY